MNAPQLTILTGASRGLGLALARGRLKRGDTLLTLSRHVNDGLQREAEAAGAVLEQWAIDLAQPDAAADRLAAWLALAPRPGRVDLVNNAAALPTIAPLEGVPAEDLVRAMQVGLIAPMLLTRAFLAATAGWGVPRRVLNISSGLGRRAMASQAAYCAAKAGMDHSSRAVALEQAALPGGARVVSLAPGVIDTDMQVQLREADPDRFADRFRFVEMKRGGHLDSPEQAAAKVLAFLEREDFGREPVADVRDA